MGQHVEITISVYKDDLPEKHLNEYAFDNGNPEQGYQFAAECIAKEIQGICDWGCTEPKYNVIEDRFDFTYDIWSSTEPGDIAEEISKALWQLFDMTYFPVEATTIYIEDAPREMILIQSDVYDDLVAEKPELVQTQD